MIEKRSSNPKMAGNKHLLVNLNSIPFRFLGMIQNALSSTQSQKLEYVLFAPKFN